MLKPMMAAGCALTALLNAASVSAQEPPRPVDTSAFGAAGAACAELRYTDFGAVDEAMTQVVTARPVSAPAGGSDFCEVEGYVWRQIRFRLRFPLEAWNHKMVVQGGGGQSGDLPGNDNGKGPRSAPLRGGYATVNHNGGHFSSVTDAKWSYYNELAAIDFGIRAPHAVTVASKAILSKFFGQEPRLSYYDGCSNGGREALMMAQRFPWDFDGIIAGAPSLDIRGVIINLYHASLLLRDQSREGFDMAAARTLNKAAIAQCDRLDGKTDGLIGNPRACKVDLKPVMCTGAASESCLSERQADIARQMYEGPRGSDGQPIVQHSAYPGSELSWVNFITPRWTIDYGNDMLRYSAFYPPKGPEWQPDPSKLAQYSRQMGMAEAFMAPLNPDLRQFKKNGGKLISYYGWSDAFGGADAIIDYYETSERVMGGEKPTQDFFRLFMMPGMDHCGGGTGASVYDYLGTLDKWVETGSAPASMTGFRPGPDGMPAFTDTVVPYRSVAKSKAK